MKQTILENINKQNWLKKIIENLNRPIIIQEIKQTNLPREWHQAFFITYLQSAPETGK